MSLATLKKTNAFFIAWMKVETKAKCDGELPSNFEIKSKFSKQWWNEAEIHLQNYKWNQNFRNSSKIWRWIPFEDRNKNKYITNFETVAHFTVALPAKFCVRFSPLGTEMPHWNFYSFSRRSPALNEHFYNK